MGIRYLDKELLAFIKPYQLTDEEDISVVDLHKLEHKHYHI
jgi:hypothetical protein